MVDGRRYPAGDDSAVAGAREQPTSTYLGASLGAPGTGFGLAIVRDLAALYGGSITLSESPLGGLRVTLRLPSALTGSDPVKNG